MFLNDCRYLPIDQRQLCSTYLVGDPLLKMIDYEEYCFLTTLQRYELYAVGKNSELEMQYTSPESYYLGQSPFYYLLYFGDIHWQTQGTNLLSPIW